MFFSYEKPLTVAINVQQLALSCSAKQRLEEVIHGSFSS